ncbi:hypothetical protein [Idiomarina abyssalis]|uniref:hypothetical protein n=1 Tax=Idiomarina abyssalis TaxID=86102 RepID=UPI003A951E8C
MQNFQDLITKIINRLYPRKSQESARIILKQHYLQSPKRYRSLTLEQLAKTPSLERPLTRERARQVLNNFRKRDLPREIELLERSQSLDDSIMKEKRQDLADLTETVTKIVNEVDTFERPIFAWRVQNRLRTSGFISEEVFFPLITELADSLNISCNFYVDSFNGKRLVLDSDVKVSTVTTEIISYASKVATHLGGTCSFEALLGPSIYKTKPQFFTFLPQELTKKYLIDLFSMDSSFMQLQSETYYAFRSKDERVSTILASIFKYYDVPIPQEELTSVIIKSLKHRFLIKSKSEQRDRKIAMLESSGEAIDEFCRRISLLDESTDDKRKPGATLLNSMSCHTASEAVKSQAIMLSRIREANEPLTSKQFARIAHEHVDEQYKSSCFSYPILYLSSGTRKNKLYRPLAFDYGNAQPTVVNVSAEALSARKELESLDFNQDDNITTVTTRRREQYQLRNYLVTNSDLIEIGEDSKACKCLICNRYFPVNLLIAAHVKRRADCTPDEKRDFENIAMLQCGGCDQLFEKGYIVIDDEGTVTRNERYEVSEDLQKKLARVSGNKTDYFVKGNSNRLNYLQHHRKSFA